MTTTTRSSSQDHGIDQRVTLHGIDWAQYELMLAIRGDRSGVRMTYLNGELELMSPSTGHEGYKTCIARLLEAYAEESGIDLNGFGSWTIKKAIRARGAEPDECYVIGPLKEHGTPDLAIEVVWTRGGIDKLEVYRGLGVPEVWFWEDDRFVVHVLQDGQYTVADRSALFADLDLALLLKHVDPDRQTSAVAAYRRALRER